MLGSKRNLSLGGLFPAQQVIPNCEWQKGADDLVEPGSLIKLNLANYST